MITLQRVVLFGLAAAAGFLVYSTVSPHPAAVAPVTGWDALRPNDAITFWTALLTFATIALGAVAYFGLRSLSIAQRDMMTRATRDARTSAIERCREFADKIINLSQQIRFQIPDFVNDEKLVVFGGEGETNQRPAAKVWADALPIKLSNQCIELLNQLESWAMYFTQELADASVAYEPCGPVFMAIVIQQYPLLVHLRAQAGSGQYPNLVRLFEAWFVAKNEVEQADNWRNMADALREQRLASKRAALKPPLGTQG